MNDELLERQSPLHIPAEDLERCHDLLNLASWHALAGRRLFVTGGTGFVGKWLLATLLNADEKLGLDCRVTVLSRDPSAFQRSWPAIAGRVDWVTGDVRDFSIGTDRFDVIIHAATDVIAHASPEDVFSTCLDGTRRVLTLARHCGAGQLLLVSSGAVYGPLPVGMTHVPESHLGGPDPLLSGSAYGEGKRVSEWLAALAANNGLAVKIARIFSLVGPHLPLDKHFAIGNFLRAAMAGDEIVIQGDGTPHRSYLHSADMAAWLWAVLLRGHSGRAYNVGADESLSIAALADRVCRALGRSPRVVVQKQPQPGTFPSHYVPDITRARHELGLEAPLPLDQAIIRTARWHAARGLSEAGKSPA
ncbi:NAD(P)-dependent oxidoreductase [Aquincola sp. J276]|uniref:NAD-dependent epimerase/dehydratase family protein n=1 Tax=Aquincola sp. J276 TaxID=2898432 RepID=UPI002151EF9D|nr:NAD(P)-dependent oxidoreductase [Aquincola sp. J276]MCR5866969.1 NAD(P)-dependent oxidoreductase [Aquincola sp. J276]